MAIRKIIALVTQTVLLILSMMPVVSLFMLFAEPRVGKARAWRIQGGWKETRGAIGTTDMFTLSFHG